MTIRSILERRSLHFSFEYFPPKTEKGERNLFDTIRAMKSLEPAFVSITCGAGGTTRSRTVEWAERIKNDIGLQVLVHLTCLGLTRHDLADAIGAVRSAGISNILALRGDPPEDGSGDTQPKDGCKYAIDLIQIIRDVYPEACIVGACYPEGHVEAADKQLDLERLKAKCDAGLDVLITQLFFDNRHYFEFVLRARSAGIEHSIIPGIMPVTNLKQVEKFTKMCGAAIPPELLAKLEDCGDDKEAVLNVGVEHATAQCRNLIDQGAPGIHFYTLNKSPATRMIVENLR